MKIKVMNKVLFINHSIKYLCISLQLFTIKNISILQLSIPLLLETKIKQYIHTYIKIRD